jgi:ABC-type sulfate transport system permease component
LFVETSYVIAALTTLPSLLLAVTMAWVLVRTLPFVGATSSYIRVNLDNP